MRSAKGKMVSRSGERVAAVAGWEERLFLDVAAAGSRKVVVSCACLGRRGRRKKNPKVLRITASVALRVGEGKGFREIKNRGCAGTTTER